MGSWSRVDGDEEARSTGSCLVGPFSAPAAGTSVGLSDAVSSLGSTRWSAPTHESDAVVRSGYGSVRTLLSTTSGEFYLPIRSHGSSRPSSRIPRMSGLWSPAGLEKYEASPYSLYAFPLTVAGGSSLWTIGSRASFRFFCGVGFIAIAAELESQLDIISEVPEGSIRFVPDRTATTSWLLRGKTLQRSRRRLCAVPSWLRARRARSFKSSSGEGAECEQGSEAFAARRDCRSSSEASVPRRIPGNGARSHGRSRWRARRSRSQEETPVLTPCSSGPRCLGTQAVIRLPGKPMRFSIIFISYPPTVFSTLPMYAQIWPHF